MALTAHQKASNLLGGYPPLDGTMEFYQRLRQSVAETDVLLDLGAGRGAWHDTDIASRRAVRDMRGSVSKIIAADVDEAVLSNPVASERYLVKDGRIPLERGSVDAIVCDYVLEHVEDPLAFVSEVDRVLKPGGLFCARTPHRFEYVAIGGRLVRRLAYRRLRQHSMPSRSEVDTFPTFYRMNTLGTLRKLFRGYHDHSYLYSAEPGYHFNSALVFSALSLAHRTLPRVLVSNIFAFMRKPGAEGSCAPTS